MPRKSDPPEPWIVAHRGASRDFRENTLKAFAAALDQGADAIELDLQLSADEVPMVYHDRTLARAGGGRQRIHGLLAQELTRLDRPRRGQHIPTLEEVLGEFGPGTRWLLEIKARRGPLADPRHRLLVTRTLEVVRRRRLSRRVSLLCFDLELLETVADAAQGVPRVLNLRPPRRLGTRLARRLRGVDGVSADVRTLTPRFGEEIRACGLPLYVYTCNTRATVERAMAAGATGIMSDRPRWLAETVEELDEA